MNETKYKSKWDMSTWFLILYIELCVSWTFFMDDAFWLALIITSSTTAFVLLTLSGIYYKIKGNELWVYAFFKPTKFPIDKISEISRTSSILSAPATSITHRLAIRFSDKKILKSSMPLLISPAQQKEFIKQLAAINPAINVKPDA